MENCFKMIIFTQNMVCSLGGKTMVADLFFYFFRCQANQMTPPHPQISEENWTIIPRLILLFLSPGISRPRADSAPPTPVNRISMSPPPSITNTTPPHSRKQRHTVVTKTTSKSSAVSSVTATEMQNNKCNC